MQNHADSGRHHLHPKEDSMRITLPRIGLGGAPLGNMFHPLSEETADATLNAAWDAGFRYRRTTAQAWPSSASGAC